ncbi:MAG TPA: hypothetical protein ENJ89_09430, partial [Caldithrix abyssi]|nr:hypothetical protein [Caldithrix abyssi]
MRTIHSIMQALHKQTGKHHSRRPAHSIQMLFGRILQNMRNLTIGASGGRFVMAGKKADRVFIPAGKISGKNGQKSTLLAANGRIKFQPPTETAFNQKDNKVVAEKKQELPPLKKKAKSVAAGLSDQPWFTGKVAKLLTQAIRNGKAEETFFSASDGRLAVKVRFKQGKLMAEIQTADPKLAKETRQILSAQIAKIKSTQGGGSEKIKVSVVRIKETTEQTASGSDRIGRGKSVARDDRPNPDGVDQREIKTDSGKEIPAVKTAGQASSLSKTSAHRKTTFKRIINEQPEQGKESPATGQKTQAKPETFKQNRVARHGNRSQVHSAGQAPAEKAADAKNKKTSSGKRGSAQNLREAESKTNGTNRI